MVFVLGADSRLASLLTRTLDTSRRSSRRPRSAAWKLPDRAIACGSLSWPWRCLICSTARSLSTGLKPMEAADLTASLSSPDLGVLIPRPARVMSTHIHTSSCVFVMQNQTWRYSLHGPRRMGEESPSYHLIPGFQFHARTCTVCHATKQGIQVARRK
jgi:hypothetical protein